MPILVASLIEPFDAPVPRAREYQLASELAQLAIAESRREGVPSRCRVSHLQIQSGFLEQRIAVIQRACARQPVVVLAPSGLDDARAVSTALATMPCILFHQNLDPTKSGHPRAFRLGIGSREHEGLVAAALLRARGSHPVIFVGDKDPAPGVAQLHGLIRVPAPTDLAGVPSTAERILQDSPTGVSVLLECGGKLNRALASELGGRIDVLFLNGNPDTRDEGSSARLTEIVGNLPERIGHPLAAATALATDGPSQEELGTVGMIAWRIDAVRLVIEAAAAIDRGAPHQMVEELDSWIMQCDGRRRVSVAGIAPSGSTPLGATRALRLWRLTSIWRPGGASRTPCRWRQKRMESSSQCFRCPSTSISSELAVSMSLQEPSRPKRWFASNPIVIGWTVRRQRASACFRRSKNPRGSCRVHRRPDSTCRVGSFASSPTSQPTHPTRSCSQSVSLLQASTPRRWCGPVRAWRRSTARVRDGARSAGIGA